MYLTKILRDGLATNWFWENDNSFSGLYSFFNTTNTNIDFDVQEKEEEYVISISAPGLDKKDFDLSLQENKLKVEHKQKEKDETNYFTKSFSKTWLIPKGIKEKDISAVYKAGILEIKVKKTKETEQTLAKIEIK